MPPERGCVTGEAAVVICLVRNAGVVAADQVVTAVRPAHQAVGAVLGMPQRSPDLRLAVGHAVAVGVAQPHHRVVAGADQIRPVEVHAVRAAGRHVGKLRRAVRPAVAVVIVQNLDVAGPGHHDATLGVDGHRKDVVRQCIVGVERDLEPRRGLQAEILGWCRRGGRGNNQGTAEANENEKAGEEHRGRVSGRRQLREHRSVHASSRAADEQSPRCPRRDRKSPYHRIATPQPTAGR